MTDKHDQPSEPDNPNIEQDLRFAPPAQDAVEHEPDADEAALEAEDMDTPEDEDTADEVPALEIAAEAEDAEFEAIDVGEVAALETGENLTPAPEVDLDAALAAISALDDVLAEEEAAEQAELARQQAEEQARADRQERLRNPELFFPMPSMSMMQRGRIDSVVPALVLVGSGAWLTFALTTGAGMPPPILLALVVCGGVGLTLLARWLASGRWALGALFFALNFVLAGGILALLLAQGTLPRDWPLLIIGPGVAFFITGIVAGESRVLLPGLLLAASSLVALLMTNDLLPRSTTSVLAGLWPAAILIILILLILPRFARRQGE
ncbi:MAG: hypothetical protein CL610_22545 [Anaerolineaceae bacterium]|nr:hypothetical protein [Anaerolineaceae bacterium]